jgi:hypothetical protein
MYRDSRWQQKRLEIMERDKWTCQSCGKSGDGVTLNVHHAYYVSGRKPWEYENELLVTYCENCHELRHATYQQLQMLMLRQPMAVFNGLWCIANFKMVKTLNAIEPGMDDELCGQSLDILSRAYYLGAENNE